MKKNRNYFLQKLSCGISRIKGDHSIEKLRAPRVAGIDMLHREKHHSIDIIYDEMMPGSPEMEDLFSIELLPDRLDESSQDPETTESTNQEGTQRWPGQRRFKYVTCTICKNERPLLGFQKNFTYAELEDSTAGFSAKSSLYDDDDDFGSTFSGQLTNELKMVVMELKKVCLLQEEFKSEVDVLTEARHENIVMLMGSCSEGNSRLLVYEYVCNGSLDPYISNAEKYGCKPLTWAQRMKIAQGASRGLRYLHEAGIIHGDVRAKNILLTHDLEPLLGNFGLARIKHKSDHSDYNGEKSGYQAPEHTEIWGVSTKADVYSFGVVLLELFTGRSAAEKMRDGTSLESWAKPLLKDRMYGQLVDPRIANSHDEQQLFWMVQVARTCLSADPDERLAMDKVASTLEYISERKHSFMMDEIIPVLSEIEVRSPNKNGMRDPEDKPKQQISRKEGNWKVRASKLTRLFSLKSPATKSRSSNISRTIHSEEFSFSTRKSHWTTMATKKNLECKTPLPAMIPIPGQIKHERDCRNFLSRNRMK
ncbi:probable serine/threonine-protein kinase PBL7 [Syzygium oleosum]|uniref:probable serine/threonine-protein kinase PBL7 n=1 Tax=Syzygium oleosum TaxID=219896 RepID=UPI0024B9A46D|nr:probable serine/threonine-protein kinase PBL7 [Syzygium oleosum]